MKGLLRPWPYHRSLAFLCLLGLRVMSFNFVEAQEENITTAKQLLALKEGELTSFVAAVEANARNCDALKGCSSTCSRLACHEYGTPGDKNYSCLGVADNTFCNVSGSAPVCMQRNFDFTKGFVRRMDPIDSHVARTVCTHRSLDDHFKNSTMNDSSHFFRVFFGAVDGTFRIYPGADEDCEKIYDPRIRPWYRESTYIPKVVTVLIDSGLNMRSTIRAGSNDDETYINKAITTALSVLDTLKEDTDYVTIVCFDGDRITQLNDIAIYNKTQKYHSFNDSLNEVEAIRSTTNSPNSTQTNNAINAAIFNLTSSEPIPPTYLKVVIALIEGQQYEDIADLTVTATPNITLFVYSFHKSLPSKCNTSIQASIETIPDDRLNNPLYALQSYYSFLAKLHISFMKNATDYGPQYQDYSGIDNQTLTLSKAAFGPNGELLGVLGIDIFEKKVEQQFPIQFALIVEEARKHDPGRTFDTAKDLNTNVCFNHTDPCPGLAIDSADVQGFLCNKTESPDIHIGCCGSCKKKKTELGPAIGGGIGGGLVALIVVGFLIYLCRRRRNRKRRNGVVGVKRDYPEYGNSPEGGVAETGSARRVG